MDNNFLQSLLGKVQQKAPDILKAASNPAGAIGEQIWNNFIYSPTSKRIFPSSPYWSISDANAIQDPRQRQQALNNVGINMIMALSTAPTEVKSLPKIDINNKIPYNNINENTKISPQTSQNGISNRTFNEIPSGIEQGFKDIRGQTVKNPKEVGSALKDYRNPKQEYLHFVYTKNGQIVAHNAVTNDIANAVGISRREFLYDVGDRINRLGADGFYIAHNHPTGNATPSQADTLFAKEFKDYYKNKMLGSIVLDHDELSSINPSSGETNKHKVDLGKSYKIDTPPIDDPFKAKDAFETHWDSKSGKNGVLVLNSANQPIGFEAISFKDSNPENINNTLRQVVRKYRGSNVLLAVNNINKIGSYSNYKNIGATDVLLKDMNGEYISLAKNLGTNNSSEILNLFKNIKKNIYAKQNYVRE